MIYDVQLNAIDALIHAEETGRPVIPFVGAGVSVESGVPAISQLKAYLAKVRFYIQNHVYSASYQQEPLMGRDTDRREYARNPSDFIRDFGWPDYNQINSDLWLWLKEEEASGDSGSTHGTSEWEHSRRMRLNRLIQEQFVEVLGKDESYVAERLTERITRESTEEYPSRFRGLRPTLLQGSWQSLLDELTAGNLDYVDSLFRTLARRRRPNAGHVFLAFLIRQMNWNLVLTTNFDNLLETALDAAGVTHTLFDVSRDAPLPHPAVVAEQTSLIKLHGSAYGLRVGERLDYPLELQAKSRLLDYLPKRATLLVMGFSGWERRMMQFVESVAREKEAKDWNIIWLHQEAKPEPILQLRNDLDDSDCLNICRISDAGRFLLELYHRTTSTHPRLDTGYRLPDLRPIGQLGKEMPEKNARADDPLDYPVHLFTSLPSSDVTQTTVFEPPQSAPSSKEMANFISAELPPSHTTIWIDLERHYTVESLITTILDTLSRYDSGLSPLVLPTDTSQRPSDGAVTVMRETRFAKAVYRIHDALRRGSYILALSSVEAFGSPFTLHHGYTYADAAKKLKHRLAELQHFLLKLTTVSSGIEPPQTNDRMGPIPTNKTLSDSFICLTVDSPHPRHVESDDTISTTYASIRQQVLDLRREIGKRDGRNFVKDHSTDASTSPLGNEYMDYLPHNACSSSIQHGQGRVISDQTSQFDILLLGLLSMFRRPRHIVAIRSLVDVCNILDAQDEDRMSIYRMLDESLERLQKNGLIYRCEGGYYWMDYVVRNTIYDRMSNLAYDRNVHTMLAKLNENPEDVDSKCIFQLSFLAQWHADIARYYYAEDYLASRNISAFTEYLYHRISSARYLSILHFVFAIAKQHLKSAADGWLESLIGWLEKSGSDGWHAAKSCPLYGLTGNQKKVSRAAAHIAKLRDADIASIHQTVLRERDDLLTAIPAETLCGWIDRICDEDLKRCENPFYTHDDVAATVKQGPQFRAASFALKDDLLDIRAKVLRERMDYALCIEVRRQQIQSYASTPRHGPLRSIYASIEKGEVSNVALPNSPLSDKFVEALRDIGTCYASQGDNAKAQTYFECVDRCIRKLCKLLSVSRIERQKVRLLYRKTFAQINPHDPWSQKGLPPFDLNGRLKQHEEFDAAEESIKQELTLVEESPFAKPHDYYEFRCFLTTLQARVCYLNAKYRRASELLERAAAGLNVRRGQERLALSVTQLYDAECRLLEVDELIQQYCFGRAKTLTGEEFEIPCQTSLNWNWDKQVSDLEIESFLLRNDTRKSDGASWITMKDIPIVYWSKAILDEIDHSQSARIDECRIRAEQRLAAADAAIENSRQLLYGSRRNVSWWHRLYVLDAQSTIERLFFMATFPYSTDFTDSDRRTLRAQLQALVRKGLRAIRSGLNNLQVEAEGRNQESHIVLKERRLLRLWLEIMTAGWFVSIMSIGEEMRHGEFPKNWLAALNVGFLSTLLSRWEWLNEAAGIRHLSQCAGDFSDFINRDISQIDCASRFTMTSRVTLLRIASKIVGSNNPNLIDILYSARRNSDRESS